MALQGAGGTQPLKLGAQGWRPPVMEALGPDVPEGDGLPPSCSALGSRPAVSGCCAVDGGRSSWVYEHLLVITLSPPGRAGGVTTTS